MDMELRVLRMEGLPGLVKFVEQTIRLEHTSSPNKPISLVGDSFGGCLALAVAARNPSIDLILILVNPGGPMKMAMVNIDSKLPSRQRLEQMSGNLTALLPCLSAMADIIPKDPLLWKLKLLKSASAYTNSRLHAVKAEVLMLASGKDNMLPSGDEAKCLKSTLQNCNVRCFQGQWTYPSTGRHPFAVNYSAMCSIAANNFVLTSSLPLVFPLSFQKCDSTSYKILTNRICSPNYVSLITFLC
ncbi:hypothetical protein Dsin_023928 [Dipteronia sinensis]|uniref:BAAT/Acyl-CoA thioester hydrolase C-terminal domain-containing protein n=1 Tax=Dipteronia sinensis TaxID=43782 RepID=A0AAE0E190_9ROSI|nr:hypothetical protein Dsin_023928 [Dipteronia sinensis]